MTQEGPFKITPLYCGVFSPSQRAQYKLPAAIASGLLYRYLNVASKQSSAGGVLMQPELAVDFSDSSGVAVAHGVSTGWDFTTPGGSSTGAVGATDTNGNVVKFASCHMTSYAIETPRSNGTATWPVHAPAMPASSAPAAAASSSAPAVAKPAHTIEYVVTGSKAKVLYGGGNLVAGSAPMDLTKPLGHPDYYAIDAQLQGSGTVTCKLLVDAKVIAQSTVSGGTRTAHCEINQNAVTGAWEDTNSP